MLNSDRDEERDEAEMRLLDDKGFFMPTIKGEESFRSVCFVVSDISRLFIRVCMIKVSMKVTSH